jgi:hypothetical protein
MSTNDVPGAKAQNNDTLHIGCWAEHDDGSLILVEGNENGRVIYSVFDLLKKPIVEYRDAMPETVFKKTFSYDGSNIKWTWHDKTPFPWDKIIKAGANDGQRLAAVDDILTAAQRVAESLKLRGAAMNRDISPKTVSKIKGLMGGIEKALNSMGVSKPQAKRLKGRKRA